MAYRWFTEDTIKSISVLFRRSCEKMGNKTALVFKNTKISYRKLLDDSSRIASFIERKTISGDRVALFMPNLPQYVSAYYGTLLAGRVVTAIDFKSVAADLKTKNPWDISVKKDIIRQVRDRRPAVVFVLDMFYPIFAQIPIDWPCAVIVTRPTDCMPLLYRLVYPLKAMWEGKYVATFSSEHMFYFRDIVSSEEKIEGDTNFLEALAQIQSTGGTTGTPKGAMLSHKNLVSNVWQAREHFGDLLEDEKEVVLAVLPLFHIYGLNMCMNMTLLALRGTLALMPVFDAKEAIRNIARHRVTIFPGVEIMYAKMLAEEELLRKTDVSSLKLCISGAGSLKRTVRDAFCAVTGTKIVEGYGMSEASPVVSATLQKDAARVAPECGNYIGMPVPGTTVVIRDDDGNEVSAGTIGRIFVSGPQVMRGYFMNEEETNKVLVNGALKTPDYGYKDSDGRLYFTDRDMMKILGENVYPANIERAILEHPAVAEVAVIGMPNPKTQETAVAVVVLKKDVSCLSEKNIQDWVCERLSRVEVPSRVIFLDSLDSFKNIIGKIQKRELREYVMKMPYGGRT
jgi:long-chain acyl-CoA synthetase